MPFDSKPEGRLSLADLSWRLRHPETWPDGFVWDYMDCHSCAMGLAWQLSGGGPAPFLAVGLNTAVKLTMAVLADAEARDFGFFRGIFLHMGEVISPEEVADAIDAHLATKVCV